MLRFIAVRLLQALVVLLVMSFLIYGLIGLMPGDPIDLMINANPNLSPADAARLRALYGLDLPIWQRYLNWLAAALQGDLGYSRMVSQPVLEVLKPRLLNTLLLLSVSLVLSLAIAIPLGRPCGAAAQFGDGYRRQPAVLRRDLGAAVLAGAAVHHPVLGHAGHPAGGRDGAGRR